MHHKIKNIESSHFFSLFFIIALTFGLFYTGNNVWFFSLSFIFLTLNLATVLWQRYNNNIEFNINAISLFSFAIILWMIFTIFTSQVKYLSIYNLFWVGSLYIVFFLYSLTDNQHKIWHFIFPLIILLIVVWACYGLIQYYFLQAPTNATFLNRNTLAALVNLGIIPLAGYYLINQEQRPWQLFTNKLLSILLLILFLTIFIITSRGASISLFIGLLLMLSLLRNNIIKKQLLSLFTIIIIALLVSYISQLFLLSSTDFVSRMMTLQGTDAGTPRFIIWDSLLPLFESMPWYGYGLGSLWVFWPPHRPAIDSSAGFFAHNDYFQFTLELGYPGIILIVALLTSVVVIFVKTYQSTLYKDEFAISNKIEMVSLFSALFVFALHSNLTYNFYVLPLIIIAGFFLARLNSHLINTKIIKLKPIKFFLRPPFFYFSLSGIVLIFFSYFLGSAFSSHYNEHAKVLMKNNQYQAANNYFLKAQRLAPLMDNPFFSHADLLRRAAERLSNSNQPKQKKQFSSLVTSAHYNLDKALELNPLRPQTYHIRGLTYELTHKSKAKNAYLRALELEPRYLYSRVRLAHLLYSEGNLKEAIKTLYEGYDYAYPKKPILLEYMRQFAAYSRKAGINRFADHLQKNIEKYELENRKNSSK